MEPKNTYISGIYAISHAATKRMYVGSAVNINGRWRIHKHHLRTSKHHSPYLQRLWNKYGEESFEFTIIQQVEHKHELLIWEQFWIDKLKPILNGSPSAASQLGIKRSAETRERIRQAKLGIKMSAEACANMSKSRKGRRHSEETKTKMRESSPRTKPSEKTIAAVKAANTGRKREPKSLENQREKVSKTWKLTKPTGEVFTVKNLAKFCRENNLCADYLGKVARGVYKSAKGWLCEEVIA